MSQGFKTSEFKVLLFNIIGFVAANLSGVLDVKYTAILTTISATAYMISRGLAKSNPTEAILGELKSVAATVTQQLNNSQK